MKVDFSVISGTYICSMAQCPWPLQKNLMVSGVTNAKSQMCKKMLISRRSQTSGFCRSTLKNHPEKTTSLTSPFISWPCMHTLYQSLPTLSVFPRSSLTKCSPRMACIKTTLSIQICNTTWRQNSR